MSVILSLRLGKSQVLKPNFLEEKNIQVVAWLIAHVLYLQFLPVLSKNSIMWFYEFTH